MKLTLLTTLIAFFSFFKGNAQFVTTIGTSSPTACDGYAYIQDSTVLTSVINWSSNSSIIQSGTYSVNNLCQGTYTVTFNTIGGSTTETFTIGNIINPFFSTGNITDPYSCDGYATITDTLLITSVEIWFNEQGFSQNGGFSADSLCPGNYHLYCTDSSGLLRISTFSIIYGFEHPCMSISSSVLTTPASDTSSCDGSAAISVTGGEPPYEFSWAKLQNMNNWGNDNFQNLGIFSPNFSNLCVGKYFVTITDNSGCSESIFFNILGDSSSQTCNDLYVTTNVFESSSIGMCDGSVKAVFHSSNPYNVIDLGYSPDDRLYNVCSPFFMASTVYDLIGCSVTYCSLVGPFCESSGDTVIFNNSFFDDSSVVETVASAWIDNCLFNFNNISGANIISYAPIGDSTIVTWEIQLINGATFSLDVLYEFNAGNGIYNVILQLVCSQKDEPKFLRVTSSLDYQSLGVEESNFSNIQLFPNPVEDELNISGVIEPIDFEIFDLNGRIVSKGNLSVSITKIDVSKLENGNYFFIIKNSNESKYLNFVK